MPKNKTKPNEDWNRFVIRKQFKFEMGHVLDSAFSTACMNPHGHSYVVDVFFMGNKLNEDGMILDFGEAKEQISDYMKSWDHAFVTTSKKLIAAMEHALDRNIKHKIVSYNPTAENMAKDMYDHIKSIIPETLKVRVHETVTGMAEYCEGF